MKQIPLTQGKYALVDDEDYEYLNQWKWQFQSPGYAIRNIKYYIEPKNRKTKKVYMHRLIMKATQGFEIDHINHNGLDNRKSNLRLCTSMQNKRNKKQRYSKISSQYKGVFFDKRHNNRPWKAKIGFNNTKIYLGSFTTEIEAARTYNEAAKKHHGIFASLNEI